jgi:ABC-type glutathione transport system ATPase component
LARFSFDPLAQHSTRPRNNKRLFPRNPESPDQYGISDGCQARYLIEAQQLSRGFSDKARGEVRAVDSVSFQCTPGEIYACWANGAGQTTTLRISATTFRPTSGGETVAGFDLIRESAKVRRHAGSLSR